MGLTPGCTLESPAELLTLQMPQPHSKAIRMKYWGGTQKGDA